MIIGVGLSGLTLYLALQDVSLWEVWGAISGADWNLVFLTLALITANGLLKAWRWQLLLGPLGRKVGLDKFLMSHVSGQMLNSVFPLRVGEVSRMVVMGDMGLGRAFVLGSIGVEKFLDMLAYGLLMVGLLSLVPLPDWMGDSGYLFVGMAILFSAVIFWITFRREWAASRLGRLLRWLPARYRAQGDHFLQSLLASLEVLKSPADGILLAFSTTLIWATALAVIHALLLAVGIGLPLRASLLVLLALQAGISVPSAPVKIGVFEYACVLALSVFGIPQALGISYGILLHTILFLPIILLGLIFYWMLEWHRSQEGQSHIAGQE